MSGASPSYVDSASETLPKVYKEAFKQLYNRRRWGSRVLYEVCRRFNIPPRDMLRTYCVLLVVRLSRSKAFRRRTPRKRGTPNSESVKHAREALLAASFSRYADRQHLDALLNGIQVQTSLRQHARYVDAEVEQDSFLRAVYSLPHSQHVSDDVNKQIANKLRSFYESSRFQCSEGTYTTCFPVAPLTEHLARYRLHTSYWRHHLLSERSSDLFTDLHTLGTELHFDEQVVDAGVRTIANAFETDGATLKFGEQFQVFNTLLNGNASSLWSKFIASKDSTDYSNSVRFTCLGRDESVERIIQAGGLGSIEAVREDPGRLLAASHISSDNFYKVVTTLSKEHLHYEQLTHLFEALCARTSVGDCRQVVRTVWREGGLSWLRNSLLSDISNTTKLTEDEACRIQSFARGYFCRVTQKTRDASNI